MTLEICKISLLATPNRIPIKVEILGDYVFDTLEHVNETKENTNICLLLLTSQEKVGKEKDDLRASNSQFELCINDLKVSIHLTSKKLSFLSATRLRFLKTKPRISFYKWLDYNAN